MKTNEIQEMLEGMLSQEQTAEVLHRLSVSPEKLNAFREHMALRGAFDRDAKRGALTEEEGDTVWAAVLGTTGALVGSGLGASGWLAKAGALVLTGLAGIAIGIGVDSTVFSDDSSHDTRPAVAENTMSEQELSQGSIPSPVRIDTVVERIVEPRIVYRDRIRYVERDPEIEREPATTNSLVSATDDGSHSSSSESLGARNNGIEDMHADGLGMGQSALASISALSNPSTRPDPEFEAVSDNPDPNGLGPKAANSPDPSDPEPQNSVPDDPNDLVSNDGSATSANARSKEHSEDEAPTEKHDQTVYSLMQDGFEIAYNERLGRISPAPSVSDRSEPAFGGRSLDMNLRFLDGRFGLGARLIHGSFAEVSLQEQTWSGLNITDTILVPSLEPSTEFSLEVFADWRIPIATERFAVDVEGSFGLSSTRLSATADLSAMYLLTPNIGAQIGVGYGGYKYTTQQIREQALDRFYNTGVTDDFVDSYAGTLLEGHYGLFYKF
jgi:hypothetical protein